MENIQPTTVKVSAASIAFGTQGDCKKCPIALALVALGCFGIDVEGDSAYFYQHVAGEPVALKASLPDVARSFILRFDDGKAVEPFEFDIVPEPIVFGGY